MEDDAIRIIAESSLYKQLRALSKGHWSFRLRKTVALLYVIAIFLIIICAQRSMPLRHVEPSSSPPAPSYKQTIASVPSYRLSNITSPQQYRICALTRVRNIADIMAQWIEYHNLLGIDQFYIMDDCSIDHGETAAILGLYEAFGLVRSFKREICNPHTPDEKAILKMLYDEAKPSCQWVAVFDVDEYIVLKDAIKYKYSLPAYLEQSQSSVLRMMWWVLGSDGHETRPDGLVIENYKKGKIDDYFHIKSMARSDVVVEWAFAHNPTRYIEGFPETPEKQGLNPSFNTEEDTKLIVDYRGHLCRVPRPPVYINHYVYRSYQEFMQTRGTRNKTNSNIPNPWAKNPRAHWLSGNFTADGCELAMGFNKAMAAKVYERLDQRVREGGGLLGHLLQVGARAR